MRLKLICVMAVTMGLALVTSAGCDSVAGPQPLPPRPARTSPATGTPGPSVSRGTAPGCPPAPYGVQRDAPGAGQTVALTFDDGPGRSTAAILATLARYRVPATFFNIGAAMATRPQLVQQEAADGYVTGNHTWDHPALTSLPAARQAAELTQASAEEQAIAGTLPCVFRPPYGKYNATTLMLAQQLRMAVWLWSTDTLDWMADGSGSAYWVRRIIQLAELGGALSHPVLLMHDQREGNPATVAALPAIIGFYRSHGYRFVGLAS